MIQYRLALFAVGLTVFAINSNAQSPYNTLINNPYQNIDRFVYQKQNAFHTAIKPYLKSQTDTIINADSIYPVLFSDKFLRWAFNRPFIRYHSNEIEFTINPIAHFEFSKNQDAEDLSWINTRGVKIDAHHGNIAVGTLFVENQAVFNDYRDEKIRQLTQNVVPGQGMAKPFKDYPNGYDYYFSEAYVSYSPSKHFNFQLGTGKHFWGDGYRSLILSDNSFSYPYFKITTDFWRIKYVNLWTQFQHLRGRLPDIAANAKKWGSFQYLSFNVTPWLNLSFFEAVIWPDRDTLGHRGFDFHYANPVIYLRPVEWAVGSPDNMLVGAACKITLFKNTALYGQLVLDEFKLDELRNRTGWYANKWAFQAGVKTFDLFGLQNVDVQTELNFVRPFMYAHTNPVTNYAHFNLPLAHPLGANFAESVTIVRYRFGRFFAELKNIYARHGSDTANLNYGNDLYLPYGTYALEYNNRFFQAKEKRVQHIEFTLSWLINPSHNLNVYAGYRMRKTGEPGLEKEHNLILFGLRTSLFNHYWDY